MSYSITIVSVDRTERVDIAPDESLLECLQRTGWHLPAPCGGIGRCGKCLVTVEPVAAAGERRVEDVRFTGKDPSRRLACRTFPVADLTVRVAGTVEPPTSPDAIAKGGSIILPTRGRPLVILERIELAAPSLADQRSVYRRLRDATGIPQLQVDRTLLPRAAEALAAGDGESSGGSTLIDVIVDTEAGAALDIAPGSRDDDGQMLTGLAFDIGTTTVAGYLLDLGSHRVIGSRSEANAQAPYGADVISRITAYGNKAPLRTVICRQLARIASELAASADLPPQAIATAAIVGNTTMMHLLMGLDPAAMSRAPFLPTITEPVTMGASEIELPIHPKARARILPGVSAYVGADIVADLLSCRMHQSRGVSLLVDIGTNGEIVCGGIDGLLACSTAAGPAFEGATIRHGSGGVLGAINHVARDGRRLIVETIAGEPAESICGTGLMDAIALLLEDGVVDETGRMDPGGADEAVRVAYEDLLTEIDGEPALILSDRSDSSDRPIVLTQGDIRQVQLAKGAIAAGIRVLLAEANVTPDELEAVYLAGGFGSYVRPAAAVRVGLLPGISVDRVRAVGNAAGAGAARMLVDRDCAAEGTAITDACRYIELSGSAAFQNHYMEEMLFPAG